MLKELSFVILLIAAGSTRHLRKLHNRDIQEDDVCTTEECKIAGEFILQGMNQSADPCGDFYEYVCGGWPVNFTIPAKESEWNIDKIVQSKIDEMKRRLLEEDIKPEDPAPLQLQKKWYQSCMDLDRINEVGLEPILNTVNAIGGWPFAMRADKWDENKYSWQTVHDYYANITGVHTLFAIDIDADLTNSTKSMLFLDQPDVNLFSYTSLSLSNADDIADNYTALLALVADAFNRENQYLENNYVLEDLKDMMEFGLRIITILSEEEERQDFERWKNYMTIADLQKLYNKAGGDSAHAKIDWQDTFHIYLKDANITISDSDTIIVREPQYITALAKLLDMTSSRTIVNYIQWMYIMKMLPYTTEELSREAIIMYRLISDPEDFPDRWEICLALDPIELGTSYEFAKRNITQDVIEEVKNVAENVRRQLAVDIEESNWLSNEIKLENIDKVNNMEVRIAYPDWYNNLTEFNHHFDGLQLGNDLYENVINTMVWSKRETMKELQKPFDKTKWVFEPTVSNAYYMHSSNSLTILAAEITLPIFDSSLPKAMNYGSIGFISGHEMSHGFDPNGRKFNKEGNLVAHWPEKMSNFYEKRVQCIMDQFNNYSTNGNLTSSENTADNAGMTAAFGAYKKLTRCHKDKKLPGLEHFTSDQLFFYSFASNFCTISREESEDNTDVHSVPPIRINGIVANSKEFAKAFQCPHRTHMCSLWK